MRFVFCLVPALILAIVPAAMHPVIGLIVFVSVFGLGLQVTQPRADRGEQLSRNA